MSYNKLSNIQCPQRTRHKKDRRKICRRKKQARLARAKKQALKEECMFQNTPPPVPGSKKPIVFKVLKLLI